jgi:hypothetical protein
MYLHTFLVAFIVTKSLTQILNTVMSHIRDAECITFCNVTRKGDSKLQRGSYIYRDKAQ